MEGIVGCGAHSVAERGSDRGDPVPPPANARSFPRASANRRISSPRSSSGSTTASTTSSVASRTMSMSSSYSARGSATNGGALVLVGDRGDLVGVDGVDRGLGAHHRDLRGRQRERRVRLEPRAGHRVEPGAVGLADDDADLRHGRLGHRA